MRTATGRRAAAAIALTACIGGAVAVVIVATARSPSKPAASARRTPGAATVRRRNLVQTDAQSGTLSYARPRTVYNRLSGTITWLPRVGRVVAAGRPLFRVDGEAVVLMDGPTPAYRDLRPSDGPGADVLELNRDLVDLAFNPGGITVDDTWQAATTAGVQAFQRSLGEVATGRLTLGEVVFLPGAQRISAVDVTLGATAGDSGTGSPSAKSASAPTAAPAVEYVSQRATPPATEGGSPRPATGPSPSDVARQIAALKAELAQLKAQSQSPQGGSDPQTSASATPVLETTSTQPVVTVDLPATVQREAAVGERVTVEMPAGETVDGTVTTVSPVASTTPSSAGQSGDNGNESGSGAMNATIPVTVTLHGRHAVGHLDHATVTVNFARAHARHVLSVPVTALLATGGGRYVLQDADPPHALIPVSTGLFAAGYVQVSSPRVHTGLRVTDSQG